VIFALPPCFTSQQYVFPAVNIKILLYIRSFCPYKESIFPRNQSEAPALTMTPFLGN